MANVYANSTTVSVFDRVKNVFKNIAQSVRDYRMYAKTRAELEALTDRELDDLGVSRLQLDEIAREAVYLK